MSLLRISVLLAAIWVLAAPFAAHGTGTPAGTDIQSTAQVSYTVSGYMEIGRASCRERV